MSRHPSFYSAVTCLVLLAACRADESVAPGTNPPAIPVIPKDTTARRDTTVSRVEVTPDTVSLLVGSQSQLSATARNAAGEALTGQSTTWTSDRPAVVTVSDSGIARAVTPGTATITSTIGGMSGTSRITVNSVALRSITMTRDTATLQVGQDVQLQVVLRDVRDNIVTDRAISWSSTAQRVATVSQGGLVAGVQPGRAAIIATAEGKSDTMQIAVIRDPYFVRGSVTLRDTVLGSTTVTSGATLAVIGARLEIDGDLLVEGGGAIAGKLERLDLVVRGNLTLLGALSSEGDLVIVDDPAKIPTQARLETERDTVLLGPLHPPSPVAPDAPLWKFHNSLTLGTVAPKAASAPPSGHVFDGSGADGEDGGALYIATRGTLRIEPAPSGTSARAAAAPSGSGAGAISSLSSAQITFQVPNGQDGKSVPGCNVKGGKGGNGRPITFVAADLKMINTTLVGGEGGDGGDAKGTLCPDGSLNRGGNGGKPSSLQVIANHYDGASIRGFSGGAGGHASISGIDGTPPGGPGASVDAEGGAGGSPMGRRLYISSYATIGAGGLSLAILNGGGGGDASGTGGKGAVGKCDPNTGVAGPSGRGGDVKAKGGAGGMVGNVVLTGTLPLNVNVNFSFVPGPGGDANAAGGRGEHGLQCHVQGGEGGRGGDATATGGKGGLGGLSGMVLARDGTASSDGGHGGNGGLAGTLAGDGGRGGHATATGNADSRANAGDGGDGGYCPIPGGQAGDGGKGGDATSSGDMKDANGKPALEESGGDGGNAGCPNGAPGGGGKGRTAGVNGSGC